MKNKFGISKFPIPNNRYINFNIDIICNPKL